MSKSVQQEITVLVALLALLKCSLGAIQSDFLLASVSFDLNSDWLGGWGGFLPPKFEFLDFISDILGAELLVGKISDSRGAGRVSKFC